MVQMAVDSWLLEQHCQGNQPSILRFYTWSPVAISLGYHQRRYPSEWHQLTWRGQPVDLVRRPTGGRAVLHQGNLTYAVIASGLSGSRMQVYQYLCQFLIEGWRSLGIELHLGSARRGYIHNPNCFGTATAADLLLTDGTKFIGSAQVWRDNAVLQHGAIQLQPDLGLFDQVFGIPLHLPSLPEALRDLKSPKILTALSEAAQHQFQCDLVEQPLTGAEWVAIVAESDRFQVVPEQV
jgi:lipoate-protein ligase A